MERGHDGTRDPHRGPTQRGGPHRGATTGGEGHTGNPHRTHADKMHSNEYAYPAEVQIEVHTKL